jgi:integrase
MASSAFDDAVDAYLRDCERRGLRPATLRYYRMVLGRFAALCAPMTPGDLSLASVRSFQDLSPRLSPGSVRGFLRALKTFSGWLTDEGLLPGDPLARLRMPRVDTRPRVMPTDQEVAAMLRTSRPTLRVVTALLLGTGIRISDAASLDADALRPGDLVVRHTKNRSGRVLPLDPVLETVLRRHREALLDTDGPLFRSRSGRALGADAVRHALTDARARVGISVLGLNGYALAAWMSFRVRPYFASAANVSTRITIRLRRRGLATTMASLGIFRPPRVLVAVIPRLHRAPVAAIRRVRRRPRCRPDR